MKKYLFFSAVGAMMLAACSNDEVVPMKGTDGTPKSQEITLTINNGGDGLTRVARPVNSSEPANNVAKVELHVYDGEGADVTSTVLTTADNTNGIVTWTAGATSKTIMLNATAPDDTYTIVAYGYSDIGDFKSIAPNEEPFTAAPTNDSFTATRKDDGSVSELFAGETSFTVSDGGTTDGINVVLTRHIAGMLGYFKNIPIMYSATSTPEAVAYVRVYASASASAFTFPSAQYSMNGTGQVNGATKVLEINMVSLAPSYEDQVSNAQANLADYFQIPATNTATLKTVANSALKGAFLIPFDLVEGNPTFTVRLENADSESLKSWTVKITNLIADEDDTEFAVLRNLFYSIGKKEVASSVNGPTDPTDGTDPTDPTDGTDDPKATDDDAPLDLWELLKADNITVTINDKWDYTYDLILE